MSYSGQCVTVADITFSHPAGGTGVAQTFQFRYEFNTLTLYGLNTRTTYVIFTRPRGSASLVHAIISGTNFNYGNKSTPMTTCQQGALSVTTTNYSFLAQDAILVRNEGRATIESFVFTDIVTFLFFNYT